MTIQNNPRRYHYGIVLIVILLAITPSIIKAQPVVINEVMASNASTLADEDGDYEDWIELFNTSDTSVDLEGYGLSDNYGSPYKWVLPNVTIQPGGFLLVWASGKDRRVLNEPLHTNYKISSSGEEVILTCPQGLRVDELTPTHIPTDISYGRQPDGSGEWYYFNEPTPNATNSTTAFNELLPKPTFSHFAGWYHQSFNLELTTDHDSAIILYTLDGSEPDINNLNGNGEEYMVNYFIPGESASSENIPRKNETFVYSSTITIENLSDAENDLSEIITTYRNGSSNYLWNQPAGKVFKGNIIRACLYHEGNVGPTITRSFFVDQQAAERYNLPAVSLVSNTENIFGYDDGIYVPGAKYFESGATATNYRRDRGNFVQRGIEWERPSHIEVFEPNGAASLSQNIGIRIHGNFSRNYPTKGLRVYARNLYDKHSVMNYAFIPDALDYSREAVNDQYKRLILHDFNQRDMVAIKIMQPGSAGVQGCNPMALFINGEFWGVTYAKNRLDKYYVAYNYGVDPDNVVMLDAPWGQGNINTLYEGTAEDFPLYQNMFNFAIDNNLSSPDNYEYMQSLLDIESFADHIIMFTYLNNRDWYGAKHFRYWRAREQGEGPYNDGKWRVAIWDFDMSINYGDVDFDMLHNAMHPTGGGNPPYTFSVASRTALLRNLLENSHFKHYFINRYADHMNTTFTPERIQSIATDEYNKIASVLQEHYDRWGRHVASSAVANEIIDYGNERPGHVREHIMREFGIEQEVEVTLNPSDASKGTIRINSIEITPTTPGVPTDPYPWTGTYFRGIPISVEATPKEGYEFSHWDGTHIGSTASISITPDSTISLVAHFNPIQTPEDKAIHFWCFNTSLPNNTPMESIPSTFSVLDYGSIEFHSALEGYPFDPTHPNWRRGSMERRNMPTDINYRPARNSSIAYPNANIRGLQVREPLEADDQESALLLYIPSTSYDSIIVRFAAKDEDAANALLMDYSVTDSSRAWTTEGLPHTRHALIDSYQLYSIDLSGIEGVANNPDLWLRIRFEGKQPTHINGNRVTFNNISVDATLYSQDDSTTDSETETDHDPTTEDETETDHDPTTEDENGTGSEPDTDSDTSSDPDYSTDIITQVESDTSYDSHTDSDNHSETNADSKPESIISLYPNPFKNSITIKSGETIRLISIRNITGQELIRRQPGSTKETIATDHLPNGVYIMHASTVSGKSISRRIIKQ